MSDVLKLAKSVKHIPTSHLHTGPINSHVAGRTDHLPAQVPNSSYVLPADIVSGAGEGNTINGFKTIKKMFEILRRHYGGLPYGAGKSGVYGQGSGPYGEELAHARGGEAKGVDVVIAGGEHVLTPEEVMMAGDGDMEAGHRVLDDFVKQFRGKTIKTLQKLPGPRRD